MKIGTHVKLPDGRIGTVVFNGLQGVGIKWGLHNPDPKDFEDTDGNTTNRTPALQPWPWSPDAFLREREVQDLFVEPCVGEEYEVIEN